MVDFRVAAKSFIVNDKNELLLLKRRNDDVMKPGMWEIPGGRLELGEHPHNGVVRETKEEAGLDVEVKQIMDVRHFVRSDDQTITMLVFLCKPLHHEVQLSEEHTDHKWIAIEEAKEHVTPFFHNAIDVFNNLEMHRCL